MFGISLTEIVIIALVALVVVGPQKLPGMLRTVGEYIRKIRKLTTEVRQQTGIDDILRNEGIDGGLTELRSMLRGEGTSHARYERPSDPYDDAVELDRTREYPDEGPDAFGALPDDLVFDEDEQGEPGGSEHAEPAADASPAIEPPEGTVAVDDAGDAPGDADAEPSSKPAERNA